MYRSNRSFNMPPPGKPRAFDTFAVPGRREFDYQSLPGGGEFDLHALGVGNLNCTHDFMWNLWRGELSWGRGVGGFSWKRLCRCGQLVTRKGLKQAWFWIYECIKVVFTMTYYQRFNATIKSSTEVNITLTCRMYKVSDDSCQWNGHDVVGGIFFIERFLCCMTHEEKLSIQWPCSSDFRRFAREVCL